MKLVSAGSRLWLEECDLKKEIEENDKMKDFFACVKLLEPLNPREGNLWQIKLIYNYINMIFAAFYGGRTNATKLYHKIRRSKNGQPLERIDYIDVCSLYPRSNKYGEYPCWTSECNIGQFETIDQNNKTYNGIIKCAILPPKTLLHPVLTSRANGKLLFTLCSTCADKMDQCNLCSHTVEKGLLIGSWMSLKIYKAVELGYQEEKNTIQSKIQTVDYLLNMSIILWRWN